MNIFLNFIFSKKKGYYPPSNISQRSQSLINYQNCRLGWFICWGMPTYTGVENGTDQLNKEPPAPSTCGSISSAKIQAWADSMQGAYDYAILTTKHHYGFRIYPSPHQYNDGNTHTVNGGISGNVTIPPYPDYDFSHSSIVGTHNQNIVGDFVDKFRAAGKLAFLYYSLGHDRNARGGLELIEGSFDNSGNYVDYWNEFAANGIDAANAAYPTLTGDFAQHYQKYIDYVKADLQLLVETYDPDGFWLDINNLFPRANLNDIYQHVKSIKPGCLMTGNFGTITDPIKGRTWFPNGSFPTQPPYTMDGTQIYRFKDTYPGTDMWANEIDASPPDDLNEWLPQLTHKGVPYYIPKEGVTHTYQTWYHINTSLRPLSQLQAYCDIAIGNNLRTAFAVSPDQNGDIPSNQLSRLNELSDYYLANI